MEDRLLVIKCKQGNRDALRSIYDKYRDKLLVLAISLCNDTSIAEDAVHDTFVGFAERIGKFKLTGSLKSYLSICVANRVRDLLRSSRNRAGRFKEDSIIVGADDPVSNVICSEELQWLSFGLAELPDEQREVIALRFYGGMRFQVIAKLQGVSVNTVKGRYRYGIDKLRSVLDSEVAE